MIENKTNKGSRYKDQYKGELSIYTNQKKKKKIIILFANFIPKFQQ